MSALFDGPRTARLKPKTEPTKIVVARNLVALMKQRGWSQQELARQSGVAYKTINKIVNLQSAPTSGVLDRLAAAFKLCAWQLSLPVPLEQLLEPDRLTSLVLNYVSASPSGRDWISRVAEREAKYQPLAHAADSSE